MAIDPARVDITRHRSALGQWELVRCRPDPRLAPYVVEYQGYREWTPAIVRRVELALPAAVVIINLGPHWRLGDGHAPGRMKRYGSFIAGLYSTYAVSENTGASHCLQFNLTPIGARRIFGVPMRALSEQIVELSTLMGPAGTALEAAIADTPDWNLRFAILDRFLLQRIAGSSPVQDAVCHAWARLRDSGGKLPIAALARELAWSRKHLASRFRDDVGLSPKTIARLLRFRRVVDRSTANLSARWSEIANESAYFDQAHLIRDFRQFAGMTPGQFLRTRLPDGSGVIDGGSPG